MPRCTPVLLLTERVAFRSTKAQFAGEGREAEEGGSASCWAVKSELCSKGSLGLNVGYRQEDSPQSVFPVFV